MFDILRIGLVNLLVRLFHPAPIWLIKFIQPKWVTDAIVHVTSSIDITHKRILEISKENQKLAVYFQQEVIELLPGGIIAMADAIDNLYMAVGGQNGTVKFLDKFAVDQKVFLFIMRYFSQLPKHLEKYGGIKSEEDIFPVTQLIAKEIAPELMASPLFNDKVEETLVSEIQEFLK